MQIAIVRSHVAADIKCDYPSRPTRLLKYWWICLIGLDTQCQRQQTIRCRRCKKPKVINFCQNAERFRQSDVGRLYGLASPMTLFAVA
jgi:hypothetical protein